MAWSVVPMKFACLVCFLSKCLNASHDPGESLTHSPKHSNCFVLFKNDSEAIMIINILPPRSVVRGGKGTPLPERRNLTL